MTPPLQHRHLVAIFDAGKTHLKLSVVDPASLDVVYFRSLETPWRSGPPYSHLDHETAEAFLIGALHACPDRSRLGAIFPIGHGAAAALIASDGSLATPILDYEEPSIGMVDAHYAQRRDSFAQTFSPDLPLGLNLGRQLFFLKNVHNTFYERTSIIVPYPQYWALRMTGVAASEVTSLGCHTDLWLPRAGHFSRFAVAEGFDTRFAPLRQAGDCLGLIRQEFAERTGLAPDIRVFCGIHDSNAAYLGHIIDHYGTVPTVISSGTWVVIMARNADTARMIAERDHLANVDAYGGLVPTARFMGGREYEAIAGSDAPAPSSAALEAIIADGMLALPSFSGSGGPFRSHKGALRCSRTLSAVERSTLATLYVALVTDRCLSDLGVAGDIVTEGPLARNGLFGPILAALRKDQRILLADGEVASRRAACSLSGATAHSHPALVAAAPTCQDVLAYRSIWQNAVEAQTIKDI